MCNEEGVWSKPISELKCFGFPLYYLQSLITSFVCEHTHLYVVRCFFLSHKVVRYLVNSLLSTGQERWRAGTLGIISNTLFKMTVDRLFLSVGKHFKHFEKYFEKCF